MIVPYDSNAVAVADETSVRRSDRNSGSKAEKPFVKQRSSSSNKQMDMIVPRFGGGGGGSGGVPTIQMGGGFIAGTNPLAVMQEFQKQIMGSGLFDINPFESMTNSRSNPSGLTAEIFGMMGFQNGIYLTCLYRNLSCIRWDVYRRQRDGRQNGLTYLCYESSDRSRWEAVQRAVFFA